MPYYKNKDELMKAMSGLSPAGRAEILYHDGNRSLAVSYGGNVTFYSGALRKGNSLQEKLGNVHLVLIKRLARGKDDGIGALGGRTDTTSETQEQLDQVGEADKAAYLKKYDNVAQDEKGNLKLLVNKIEITSKTVSRERREELAELHTDAETSKFNPAELEPVILPVKDDNYILAKWDGDLQKGKTVTAVDPVSFTYQISSAELDAMVAETTESDGKGELKSLSKFALFDALQRYGKPGGKDKSEDGRDLSHDYRYPHEYFSTWKIASDILEDNEHRPSKLVDLAKEVQSEIYRKGNDYKIDFYQLANAMKVTLSDMDIALNLFQGTIRKMQDAINIVPQNPGPVKG